MVHGGHVRMTLDYPPLFAWFQWLLSQLAVFFDPRMLDVKNLNYASEGTILFQRLTVIFGDLVLLLGVKRCADTIPGQGTYLNTPAVRLAVLTLGNAGLLIVDHIHFQYNGLLLGLLLISYAYMAQGRYLKSALTFAVLLNMKHIFLYMAPAYFVFLLRNYCIHLPPGGWIPRPRICNTIKLGLVVVSVFLVSFGPFLVEDQLPQVLSRLFPFKRGLCHAYWAPNFWVFYNLADKLAVFVARARGLPVPDVPSASMTGGLVQEFHHVILPSVTPVVTFFTTLLTMLPALAACWRRPADVTAFLRALLQCAFSSFLFGWHVHEKAILMVTVPLALLALRSHAEARLYLVLTVTAHFSLFPLLFTAREAPLKLLLLLLHAASALYCLPPGPLSRPQAVYLAGLAPLYLYQTVGHGALGLAQRWPFLPLLLTSLYCALGTVYCWLAMYRNLLRADPGLKVKQR